MRLSALNAGHPLPPGRFLVVISYNPVGHRELFQGWFYLFFYYVIFYRLSHNVKKNNYKMSADVLKELYFYMKFLRSAGGKTKILKIKCSG
jgi:hypothetical protein